MSEQKQIITPGVADNDSPLLDDKGQALDAKAEVDILNAHGEAVHDAAQDPRLFDAHGNTVHQEGSNTLYDKQGYRLEHPKASPTTTEDVLKGFVAGMVGGLVGTAVKSLAEQVFPPRPPEQDSPPVIAAERVIGEPLSENQKQVAEQSIHWTFGTVTGGVYGALAEAVPQVSAGYGVPFSGVLFAAAHEAVLPALDLEEGVTEQPASEQINELITHVAYGLTTDLVRRYVRKRL